MIRIQNLEAWVWEKQILKGISLDFELWKNYCLLGKNGSGKSTLSSILMGHPSYEVTWGEITITSSNSEKAELKLLEMWPDERSQAGIFLSFQNIPEIKWVKLSEFLRTIFNISAKNNSRDFTELSPFMFQRFIKKYLDELDIDEKFLKRDLNVGFSGGEKRKIEILQMKLIWPKYIILDEIDSGLDLDAFKTVATMLSSLSGPENSLIIITHYFTILDYVDVDRVFVMKDGQIVKQWGKQLAEQISKEGFEKK